MRRILTLLAYPVTTLSIALVGYTLATAAPVLLNSRPLPCGGAINYFDTDGDASNGAEQITVTVPEENAPRAVILFADGDAGAFKSAKVVLPGKLAETFTSYEKFIEAYPSPCQIVEATRDEVKRK